MTMVWFSNAGLSNKDIIFLSSDEASNQLEMIAVF